MTATKDRRVRTHGLALLVLLALTTCGGEPPASGNDPIEVALARIEASALRRHVAFLADDRLAGRRTGTHGYELAADYVGEQFARIGLRPAGDNGSYLGRVRLRRASAVAEESSMSIILHRRVEELTSGVDYVAGARIDQEQGTTEAPAVFVGFGVSARESGYDDYRDVDARGKLVVVLRGAPASLASDASAHYSSGRVKSQIAAEHGAVGIVTVLPPTEGRRGSWEGAVASAARGSMQWLRPDGSQPGGTALATASMSVTGAAKLFAGAERTIADVLEASGRGAPGSFDLRATVRLAGRISHTDLKGFNVLGILPGSDADLADKYIVVTAHLDHVGIGSAEEGDSIYNGAADNAAGVGSLIEVARALSGLPTAPRRSFLFVATTAEEEGLLGARYLAANPLESLGTVIANINMDGNLMLYPMANIIAVGGEHTSLGAVAAAAANRVGLEIQPDPMPEQNLFIRSDHYAFVLQGIPSVALMTGTTSSDPSIDGRAVMDDWIATTLHRPNDDAGQSFDYESGADYVRTAFLIAEHVGNTDLRPHWVEGDFFGEAFGARGTR